jgi:hypothetical protein
MQGFDFLQGGLRTGENWVRLFNALVMLIGTITTLLTFQFTRRAGSGKLEWLDSWIDRLAVIGRGFIALALGAFFAGVLSAAVAALIERLVFMIHLVKQLI